MNIYFYAPANINANISNGQPKLYLNTVVLYLDSWIRINNPDLHKNITWSKIQLLERSQEQLLGDINSLDIDILCISLYIWNQDTILDSISKIKEKTNRLMWVIAGGPGVSVHREKSFLDQNPDIDFAVYAQGERAFADVLASISGSMKLNVLNTKNLAWIADDKLKLADYEFIKRPTGSPYLESQDLLRQIVLDPSYQDYGFLFPYETSKGCPYGCTFCDWNSGLSHKVSYRKGFDYESELELLGQLGVVDLHLSDANVGQLDRDIDIVRYMAQLKKEKSYAFYIHSTNFSKLNKANAQIIIEIILEHDMGNPKFAVQDTNQQVLDNIERPDIPWLEHRKIIDSLSKKYPKKVNTFAIELIQGLPGQTRSSWEQTLIDTHPYKLRIYKWIMIPNSPAAVPEYAQRMQLTVQMLVPAEGMLRSGKYMMPTITGTLSYDFTDYAYFSLLSGLVALGDTQKFSNKRVLFDRVRASQHLTQTLEQIKKSLLGTSRISVEMQTAKFLNLLIKESFVK